MLSINPQNTPKSDHQEIWNLLPWYVNRTLDIAERDIVKRHIKTCIACRIELDRQQQVFENIQQIDLLNQVSQVSYAQLKKRIKNHTEPDVVAIQNQPDKLSRFFTFERMGFFKYTALVASLLLLAVPFMLISSTDKPDFGSEYRTLANSSEGEPRNNVIRIVFADQSDSEQIEVILESISGRIVKGPSQNGVYEVAIGDQSVDTQKITDTVAQLRKNSRVIFAELAQ